MNLPIKQRPIYSKPRRLAPAEKEIVEKQVALQQWLEEEPIELIVSEYGSTGFVAKTDGTATMHLLWSIKQSCCHRSEPASVDRDILDKLCNTREYSTTDLRNVFLHVDDEKKSRKHTAFVTHSGNVQFLKVSSGPYVFQRFINNVFR